MKTAVLPSLEYLNECFTYDPKTGGITWNQRPSWHFQSKISMKKFNAQFSGKNAGTVAVNGYRYIGNFLSHRLIFKIMTGKDPVGDVDHKNLDRSDNRWVNLREASRSQNMQNTIHHQDNAYQMKGVGFSKQKNKFRARIRVNGREMHLGFFLNPKDAHRAYCKAACKFHGEFLHQQIKESA